MICESTIENISQLGIDFILIAIEYLIRKKSTSLFTIINLTSLICINIFIHFAPLTNIQTAFSNMIFLNENVCVSIKNYHISLQ